MSKPLYQAPYRFEDYPDTPPEVATYLRRDEYPNEGAHLVKESRVIASGQVGTIRHNLIVAVGPDRATILVRVWSNVGSFGS